MSTETVIVGAGPAGLAVAGRLRRLGRACLVLERGSRVGESWHGHYRRLRLHTVKERSHLPHRPFPAAAPRYVSRQHVLDYLEEYAREMEIAPRFGQEVAAVEPREGGWRTRTAGGDERVSRHVVVATGFNRVPRRPRWPGQEGFAGTVEHSRSYRDGAAWRGRRVLVVGMGNTGAEIALDLAEHGARPTISVRGPVNIVPRDVLGRPTQLTALALARLPERVGDAIGLLLRRLTVGDLSRWGLETPRLAPAAQLRREARTPVIDVGTVAAIRRGAIVVRPAVERFTTREVGFVDGRQEPFDHVVLATGYDSRVGDFVPEADALLDERGHPRVVCGEGRWSGLHFVGFDGYTPGGLLGTIHRDSALVAERIAAGEVARGA